MAIWNTFKKPEEERHPNGMEFHLTECKKRNIERWGYAGRKHRHV